VEIRPLGPDDRPWARAWGATVVARRGELVDAGDLPGFVAQAAGRPLGLLTWQRVDDAVEVVSLQADVEGRGVGRALMDAVAHEARRIGAGGLWLVTTNDNRRAIAFYERYGMTLAEIDTDAVVAARRLKPSIPEHGADGTPVRDEYVFTLDLTPDLDAAPRRPPAPG